MTNQTDKEAPRDAEEEEDAQVVADRPTPSWSREESTDVRSRPLLGAEESDVTLDVQPRTRRGVWEPNHASITRTGVKPLAPRLDAEERGGVTATRVGSGADHDDAEAREGVTAARMVSAAAHEVDARAARADDLATLWRAFDRSLGKPLERPERLRLDHMLGLSSVEITTLRKILGWLRQIDAVVSPAALTTASPSATSLLLPVERGRLVLTPSLRGHLRAAALAGESEAQSLARWIYTMARQHRALPWELVAHEVEPHPASAPRLTPLELLLACRPAELSAPADLACAFAAQTDALSDETWIFGRGADGALDGLILARSPALHALRDVYEAAAQCSELLTNLATLKLRGPRSTVWCGILPDLIWFSYCGRQAISLQCAPLRSMGLILSRIHALELAP